MNHDVFVYKKPDENGFTEVSLVLKENGVIYSLDPIKYPTKDLSTELEQKIKTNFVDYLIKGKHI